MFYISIYNEHAFAPPYSFPYLYYTIIYYIREHSFPHILYLCPAPFLPLYTLLLYTLYIEKNILSRNFLPFPHSFIILLLYIIEEGTLSPPFFTPYKVNTFTPPFSYPYSLGKVRGEKFLKTLLV